MEPLGSNHKEVRGVGLQPQVGSSISSKRQRQILAVLLAAFGVLSTVSLGSFRASTQGFAPWTAPNACGPAGAVLAAGLVWAFGRASAFGVPLLAFLWSWNRLRARPATPLLVSSLLGALLVFEVCALFGLAELSRWTWAGGWGFGAAMALHGALGGVGSWVVAGALLFVTALAASEFGFHWIAQLVHHGVVRPARGVATGAHGVLAGWNERRAGAARSGRGETTKPAKLGRAARPVGAMPPDEAEDAPPPRVTRPAAAESGASDGPRITAPVAVAAPPGVRAKPLAKPRAPAETPLPPGPVPTDPLPAALAARTARAARGPRERGRPDGAGESAGQQARRLRDRGPRHRDPPGPGGDDVRVRAGRGRQGELRSSRSRTIWRSHCAPSASGSWRRCPARARSVSRSRTPAAERCICARCSSSAAYEKQRCRPQGAPGRGRRRPPVHRRPDAHAARARGRGDRGRQERVPEHGDHGAPVPARSLDPADRDGRPQDGRVVDVQRHPAPGDAGRHRAQEGAPKALRWAVCEMEKRYKLLATGRRAEHRSPTTTRSRRLEPIGRWPRREKAPERPRYVVVIVDELADLMLTAPAEIEEPIARLAQMARAVGIHLVLATQRPSVDVITGVIKANFPSRIAFRSRARPTRAPCWT